MPEHFHDRIREPFAPTRGACGGPSIGGRTGFAPCGRAVTTAGTIFFPHDRSTWNAFTCDTHRGHLDGPRELTDDDRAELAHRREQERRAMAGQAFERVQPISGPRRRWRWR